MYGLPKDFNGEFLEGRSLELVCFNANQLSLHFDKQIMITIESAVSYQPKDSQVHFMSEIPITESNLMRLLEKTILNASGNDKGDLTLTFQDGDVLTIYDNAPSYESYKIQNGDEIIIV